MLDAKFFRSFDFYKGVVLSSIAYPIAELVERRDVTSKLKELRRYYAMSGEQRLQISRQRLFNIVEYAYYHVPYYRDLFSSIKFDIAKLRHDSLYMNDIPILTKEIILEQSDRMLSKPLSEVRSYACKTGGSTGQAITIHYDQPAVDYSAAVTVFCRESIGHKKYYPEVHCSCQFPGEKPEGFLNRETFKCIAMNRTNVRFDKVDDSGLDNMMANIVTAKPYLLHEHPSTIYALACHAEAKNFKGKPFEVFESSGELLRSDMRHKIEDVFSCRVVNRYGLAELGVVAYDLSESSRMEILLSECWPEHQANELSNELLFTSYRNRLMPLIRYASGDLGTVKKSELGFRICDLFGRVHDVIEVNGTKFLTHHIMDVIDHRVGNVVDFQILLGGRQPIMRVVKAREADERQISERIEEYWPKGFKIEFVHQSELILQGDRAKFRHMVLM